MYILKRTIQIKEAHEKIFGENAKEKLSDFEEDYFLKKLLKWEIKMYKKRIIVNEEDLKVNEYFFDIIMISIDHGKPFLAEMIIRNGMACDHEG